MKFSSKALRCQQSPMRKFHPYAVAAAAAGKKIYHLNIGQPDIQTPPQLFEAVRSFHEATLAYAPSPGIPALIDAICSYYARIGVTLDAGNVLVTTGGSEALQIACNCILDDGDEIIIPEPFYPNYHTFITTAGASIHPLHTKPEEGYFFADREKIEACITSKTKAIMITNPGNPTGTCLTRDEMKMILDVAVEHDLYLIADEVYREFAYETGELLSFLQFGYGYENLILIDSVSKRFSACGARIGAMISRNKEFMAQAMKLCQGRLCPATIDQLGAAAMYRSVEPSYFENVRTEYKKRRDAVVEELAKIPGVTFSVPDGAFYIMATLPVDDAEKLQYFLLEEFEDNGDTVMYAPGSGFYADPAKGRSEIRIAYVKNCDYLRRAIQLVGKGVAAYNAKRGV